MKIIGIILMVMGGFALIGELVGGHVSGIFQLAFEIGLVIIGAVLYGKENKK
jgi:hypothetical protein